MKTRFAILLAAGAAVIAVPAMAQDTEFSGPWIAGVAGYDRNQAGSSQDDGVNVDLDQNSEGLLYGVGIGYDADMGSMVVGAEAELTDSTADSSYSDPYTNFGLGTVDAGRDIYVGGRVGFKATPTTLVYGKGGYSFGRYNFIGTDGTTNYDENLDVNGWRVGAGVEQKFGSNAFAKIEYRYTNYSRGEIDFEADGVADSDRFDIDTDRHQVMAGVGWRF
ncbi:MAG TPA: outer membrane beta-barrel protein [Croceibacterium sp.]|nr:outer membrane beta-barrel protein [Croceibacterium sp.]